MPPRPSNRERIAEMKVSIIVRVVLIANLAVVAGFAQSAPDPANSGPPIAATPNPDQPTIPQTFTTGENTWYHGPIPNTPLSLSEKFNQLLPPWLRFSGEVRERFEGYTGSSFKPNSTDDYVLDRLRIGVLIRPTHWLSFFGQMQDARVWARNPALPPYQNTWDIRQAYVEIGSTEGNEGFSVQGGRIEMNYGNGRLIGNSWWTNVSRSFDGVRATFHDGPFKVDVFTTSVVIVRDGVIDHHNQGNNLNGIYGQLKNPVKNSIFEPYGFWHVQPDATLKSGKLGHLDQFTWGLRFLGTLPKDFDYRTEMAIQRGTLGPSEIRSWMGHWTGGYTLRKLWWQPRLFVEYDYASGDNNPKDASEYSTFDPIYPSTHDKLGLADQIGWRNIRDLRFGQEFKISRKLTVGTSIHDFWLANAHDSLYPTRGSVVAKDPTGNSGTHVGEEFDVQAVYKLTRQTQLGAGYGRLFTGEFLNRTTKGIDYNYPYMLAEYVF
jgi:hypothetical protein